MKKLALISSLITLGLFGTSASATILQADFFESLDLPGLGAGPKVASRTGVSVGAGAELTAANVTSNPSGWGGFWDLDLDGDAYTLRLFNGGGWEFYTGTVKLENIVFANPNEVIAGISLISNDDAAGPAGSFTRTTIFTDDSFTLKYDRISSSTFFHLNSDRYSFDEGYVATEAIFKIQTRIIDEPTIPEPATLALLGLGLLGLGLSRRRAA